MKADLTNVFKDWFEVAATPVDIAANAVQHWTQGKIQPFVDEAEKSKKKQLAIINASHPGLVPAISHDMTHFKNKIEQATDTTVDYAKRSNVPALDVNDIPGVQKIKEMTCGQKGGRKKQRKRRKRRKIKTKKRALKEKHHIRNRKRSSRRKRRSSRKRH